MIAGLLLFLILPLAVAVVVYVMRQWAALSSILAFAACVALGIIIIVIPLGRTVEIWGRQIVLGGTLSLLGRELVLRDFDRVAIAFLYLTAAATLAMAWWVSRRSLLFPAGLVTLSLLSGSLLIRPLIYSVLLLQIALAVSVFALQREDRGPTRGGLQYLSFSLLALPGLLTIHWLMERYALTPENTALLQASAVLVVLSFAMLLGSVPFHTWIPSLTGDGDLLASSFVLTVNHSAVWFLMFSFLETYPEFSAHADFASLASTAGLAMVAVGGLFAAAQRRPERMVGYAALIDSGAALVALGLYDERGLALALLALMVRPFGLVLLSAGLQGLRAPGNQDDGLDALRGMAWRSPGGALAFLMGGMSIAGMPITAGFAARWALYRALAPSHLGSALLLIAATVGLMIGIWRTFTVLMKCPRLSEGEEPETERRGPAPGPLVPGLVTAVALASVSIGLWPQIITPISVQLASLVTFLP